ncbi:MAG: hypothetical protein ABF651_08440 [Sporolactobacillus sp.]
MDERWPILSSALSNQFSFRELSLVQEDPLLIQTERGLKKIRFWEDEHLLKQHLDWRKKLLSDDFFLDRMYATAMGSPFIRFDRYAVTCHDAPLEFAEVKGNEQIWAEMLAVFLKKSRGPAPYRQRSSVLGQAAFDYAQIEHSGLSGSETGKLVSSCFPTVRLRAEKADRLRSPYYSGNQSFILPENFSFENNRFLMGTLFIELGQSKPIAGYPELARFFLHTALEEGEETLTALLEQLSGKRLVDQEMRNRLLAEWYDPDEWFRLAYTLNPLASLPGPDEESQFRQIWNYKTRLIRLFEARFPLPD